MKSFLASLIAIVVVSIGAKFALEQNDMSAQSVYSSKSTSLGN